MSDEESVADETANRPIKEQENSAVETLDPAAATESRKREPERTKTDDTESSSASEDEWIGPMPTEAVPAKKRKGINSSLNIRHNLQILASTLHIHSTRIRKAVPGQLTGHGML